VNVGLGGLNVGNLVGNFVGSVGNLVLVGLGDTVDDGVAVEGLGLTVLVVGTTVTVLIGLGPLRGVSVSEGSTVTVMTDGCGIGGILSLFSIHAVNTNGVVASRMSTFFMFTSLGKQK
jgi:hypothetical protein